jgi:rod shape-determining protein MreC
MYKKNKNVKRRVIIICSIVFCLTISSIFITKNFNLPNYVFKDGVMFVNKFVNRFFNKDYNRLERENESLRKELEIYKDNESLNVELKSEISKLKEVTGINKLLSDREYINGTVINRNLDYWQNKLIVDKGSINNITNNMAVVSNGSLIGITDDVSLNSSSVLLLCNKKFPLNISVKIKINDSYVYGILNSYNENSGLFEVVGVVDNIEIPSGSLVYTTGFGNIFPSGILIGSVSDVTTDNFDLAKVINVKSSADFDDISYVTIVKRGEE